MRPTPLLVSAAIAVLSVAACSKSADQTNAPSAVTNAEAAATPSANPASTDLSTTDVTKAANTAQKKVLERAKDELKKDFGKD